jgi:cyclic pyranopterin phosphate synthase
MHTRTAEVSKTALVDGCGRRIDHLRLSLTDRCNLACRYCSGGKQRATSRIDAALAVALACWLASRHGVRHVRLTGGEPLLHPQLTEMVAALSATGLLEEITLTTNGQALAGLAQPLQRAGLTRVNISLDTLDAGRFSRLTGGGEIGRTLCGVEEAIKTKLGPVRLNVVAQRGFNDDELSRIAEWGLARGCIVRFLEAMPIGPMLGLLPERFFPASEIIARLARRFSLQSLSSPPGQPATDYAATSIDRGGPAGVVGVIASTTRPFCLHCRRLRITARGDVLSCLFDTPGSSLSAAWDGHTLDEEAADRILQAAVMAKPQMGRRFQQTPMIAIGG